MPLLISVQQSVFPGLRLTTGSQRAGRGRIYPTGLKRSYAVRTQTRHICSGLGPAGHSERTDPTRPPDSVDNTFF